jgi:PAS domain S-box-containing protein
MIRFFVILGVFLALSVPSVTGAGAVTAKPKIIVGGDHDCPPYEYLENGKPTGFDVELMRAVADVIGFDVEFRLGKWNRVRQDLEEGRIDALAGMYYSADRSRLVDFSVPHTMVSSGILVRKGSAIRSYVDIQGKEIIVQEGDIIHDALRRNGLASRIVAVTDAPQVLELLSSGKHDCAFMPSRLQAEYYIKTYGYSNIRFINSELPLLRYCFAVRKGNKELLYKLDEGMKILKVNGKYQDIYNRWFGVYERKDLWEDVKFYVLALALIAALCLIFLAWSWMLKRRVEQKTAELRRSEEALRLSEERYRALHRDNPTMIFTMDADGKVLSVNPTGADKLGYTIDELEGQPVLMVFHEEDRPAVVEQMQECLRNPNMVYGWQFRKIRKDGGLLWGEELAQAVYDLNGMLNVLVVCQDVTERKMAEEALRESEEKFRVLAETSPSGVCLYQGERILYVNPATTRLFGYSEEECLQMNFWDWVHEDSREMARERGLARQRGEQIPSGYECRHVAKDGRELWMYVSAGRIDYGGKPACIVTFFDITDRKRMEEELRNARDELEKRVEERTAELARTTEALSASEQEKSLILNNMGAGVIYFDPDMNILWANKAACDYSNITPEELRKRRCWEVWHQRREPCAGCPVLLARDTGQPREAESNTPDGRVWFICACPVRNETGRLIGMVEFIHDFTERKRMEKALREANLVVENSPAVLFRWKGNDEWPVELVSGNVMQFGYTPDEFLSGSITYSSIILPDDLERVTREVHDFCDEGADQFRLEYRIMTRDGDIRWVNEHTNVERDAAGGVKNFEGIVIDITERKLVEEQLERQKRQLQELNSTLENRVREEVGKNREKDLILIQQNRQAALGELLDHIAHQWKQPLNAISFIVQDAEATWTSGEMTNEYVSEAVTRSMGLVEHMAQTIEVFRDFYRPEKEKTAFNVKDSIAKALSFISPVLRFHAIALDLDVDPGLTAIGYPKEYAQVLLNIMTNARNVFVERKTEKPRLEIRAFEEEAKAVVTITDNGGGIPDTIIDKVFDLYFTTRESSGGTGVGLYMSKNIINNMGGKLSAANVDGGARFTIELDVQGSCPRGDA